MGRSQGAVIFWGLVSVFFAAAFCYYFSKNHENEKSANLWHDQFMTLQEERDALTAEKKKLQDRIVETETELKTREDVLQDKETSLADVASHLEAQQASQANPAQAAVLKKFTDTIHKIDKDDGTDVVDRNGRPVLRVPNGVLFASGEATLKSDGKVLLSQIAQTLAGQTDHFELRIESFTDSDAETQKKADPAKPKTGADADTKPHYATSWELTAARATAIARYYHDQTSLPFQNVLVIGRGDSEPVASSAKEGHMHNHLVEISIAPLPAPFHAPDAAHAAMATPAPAAPVGPLLPPPDPTPTPKK